jgi:predicted ArsR family transcriptional regulator
MKRDDEIKQLKERLFKKDQLILSSQAQLATVVIDHFGKEAEEVINNFIISNTHRRAKKFALSAQQANKKNDIKGLIQSFWIPLLPEGFKFTYEKREEGYQMNVTNCPIANIAKALNLEKWGYTFHCMGNQAICDGYNPEIHLRRTKTLMEGDAYCDHFYFYYQREKDIPTFK